MLSISFFMGDFPKSYKPTVYMLHKSTGLLILFLMAIRLVWTFCSIKPALPTSVPKWQAYAARLGHYGLYILLFAMPITGLTMSVASNRLPTFYGLFTVTIPGLAKSKALASFMNSSHEVIAWILLTFVVIHILAVIKHMVINKDGLIRRMMPG
jgi:cytochrome b561